MITLSASQIKAFDTTEAFGCERRWFFQYVMRVPYETPPHMLKGTALHKFIEEYLTHGEIPDEKQVVLVDQEEGQEAPASQADYQETLRLFTAMKPEVDRVRDEGFLALEKRVSFQITPTIKVKGNIDVVREVGPLDWKTSSNLSYAPTPYKLARDTQMALYAHALAGGSLKEQIVSHVYVQTKKTPLVKRVDAVLPPSVLTSCMSRIISVAEKMEATSKIQSQEYVEADRTKCRAGTKIQCSFYNICKPEKESIMSAVDRLKARLSRVQGNAGGPIVPADAPTPSALRAPQAPPAEVPKPTPIPAPAQLPLPISIPQPPPAPPTPAVTNSSPPPEVVLPPVPESTDTTAPKRGRGRPPGASKIKVTVVEPAAASEAPVEKPPVASTPSLSFTPKSITVAMTGKLNMGHYQTLDVHVSQTADYQGDPNEAFVRLTDIVKKQLDAALETVAGRTVQMPVPNDVLATVNR